VVKLSRGKLRRAPSRSRFGRFATLVARLAGRPVTFGAALLIVVAWAVMGPIFGFSDTWQLVINTGTTIVTFLMVFLIQSTQNRDTYALQIKLDELIRALPGAHSALLDLEELDEDELDRVCADYRELARDARADLARGRGDTDVREVPAHDAAQARDRDRPAPTRAPAVRPRRRCR
jgi:low affinity Fe/Cu permease